MAGDEGITTVGDAVRELTDAFRQGGIESAGLDARRLVTAATGLAGEALIREPDHPLDPTARMRLRKWRRRRLAHEPVSRILGQRAFYGRDFTISADVLDPRPETETVVEAALAVIDDIGLGTADRPGHVLDIGVGSGAIVVTLLAERPLLYGTGIDVSDAALAIARMNAEGLGVSARLTLCHGRTTAVRDRRYDLVIANPPYIPTSDLARLDPDVLDYDPRLALDGGADGLDIYREIFSSLATAGADCPLVLEVGDGQAEAVAELARVLWPAASTAAARFVPDLGGRRRGVVLTPHKPVPEKNRFLPPPV